MSILRPIFAVTLSALILVSCTPNAGSSSTGSTGATGATTGVAEPAVRRMATLPDGFQVQLEVATDDATRAQGLMFRESLPAGRGMLFLFRESTTHPFWMKNTLIPLDMIWMDAEGRVVEIEKNVPPCQVENCPSFGGKYPSSYVLELAAGEAEKHNVTVGSTIRLEGISDLRIR